MNDDNVLDLGLEMASTDAQPDKDTSCEELSFKEASEELEAIVRLLESNQLELEDALRSYERGVFLLRELQTRLATAQQQITVLMGELEPESSDSTDTTLS